MIMRLTIFEKNCSLQETKNIKDYQLKLVLCAGVYVFSIFIAASNL